jgi:predicted porin
MPFYRNSCLVAGIAAAACALPAQDKTILPNVQVYGTLIAWADNIQATGASTSTSASNALVNVSSTAANVPARNRISCGTSNIGFKGDFQTPVDELKVFWQVESSVSVDGDQPSVLAGRNSALGLTGKSWGRVFVGSWDTPYKYPTLFLGASRGLFPFDGNLYGNPGFNIPGTVTNSGRATSKNDASFSRRQGNSIQYWSPEWSGLSARLAYSVNEGRSTTDNASQPQVSPSVLSALVSYKNGGLALHVGYERHNDYFGLNQMTSNVSTAGQANNASSRDEGLELVGIYAVPSTRTRVTAIVEQLKYHNDEKANNMVQEYKRTAWSLSVQQGFGDHKVWATYGSADKGSAKVVGTGSSSTEGLGARQLSLGYSYALGKSAELLASYYTVRNDAAATYGLFPVLTGINPGADTRGFGVGMLYTF